MAESQRHRSGSVTRKQDRERCSISEDVSEFLLPSSLWKYTWHKKNQNSPASLATLVSTFCVNAHCFTPELGHKTTTQGKEIMISNTCAIRQMDSLVECVSYLPQYQKEEN